MTDPSPPTVPTPARVAVGVAATGLGAWVAWWLHQLLFRGLAQSFDTLLYARALWGLGHLDTLNPVAGVHVFSVHAHWVLVPLAPLVHLAEPAMVLIAAQSVALAATAWLVGDAVVRACRRTPSAPVATLLGVLAIGAGVAASPWVVNPFLFDARPDVLGVPVVLWALLRIEARGDFDLRAAIGLLASLTVREELALLVIMASLFAPTQTAWRARAGLRIGTASFALGYWALYWLVLRGLLGGDAALDRVASTPSEFISGGLADQLAMWREHARYKFEMLATAVLTLGGLALLAPRWWVVALPGVAWVVLPHRYQAIALNFHYALFAAPALLTAGVAGWRRVANAVASQPRWVPVLVGTVVALISGAVFATSSALPGGGRFRPAWFVPDAESDPGTLRVSELHEGFAAIDDAAPLSVSYTYAAPLADRRFVEPEFLLRRRLRSGGAEFEPGHLVALTPSDAHAMRALLIEAGFAERSERSHGVVVFEWPGARP